MRGSSMRSTSVGSGMSAGLWSSTVVAVAHVDVVDDRGRGGDQVDVVFTLDPVADHLEVEKAQEAAAEAKAEGGGGFHFGAEAGVVQGQFFDGVAQVFEFGGIDGEEATEHHGWTAGLKPAAVARRCPFAFVGDGVADAGVADLFDRRGEEADFAGAEFRDVGHLGFRKTPRRSMPYFAPVCIILIASPLRMVPSMTRIMTTTPR